jgi:MarR family transcriptional regulator for hemolysin
MKTNCELPLGKLFGNLAKAYANAYTEKLKGLPIDRYFYALVVIDEYKGDLSQSALAEELMVDKAMVVRMLDYLENNDCIIRKQHPADRRAHLLELTPAAYDLLPKIKQGIIETNELCHSLAKERGVVNFHELMEEMGAALSAQGKGAFKFHFIRKDENDK